MVAVRMPKPAPLQLPLSEQFGAQQKVIPHGRGESEEVAGRDQPEAPAGRDLVGEERHRGEAQGGEEEDEDEMELTHD